MNQSEQISAFSNDLEALIERYGSEFDLTYASVLGVIELAKSRIIETTLNEEK